MFKRLLAALMSLALLSSFVFAEETVEPTPTPVPEVKTVGIADLMTKKLEVTSAERVLLSAAEANRTLEADLSGTHLKLSFQADASVTDEIWSTVSADLLTRFAYLDWSDPRALVNAVPEALCDAPVIEDEPPLWQTDSLKPVSLRAENPYYPELSKGVNCEMTRKLQQRLIETGFLTDKADGFFGNNTLTAVKEIQDFVKARLSAKASEMSAETEPMTEGTVSPELLFYLLSDEFRAYTGNKINEVSPKDEIKRMQRRLIAFGCLVGTADGCIGENTVRGIRIFQYANGLDETGIANEKTLTLLFGPDGKAPDHPLMMTGSTGDDVKKLQTRLLYSGFSTVGVDGKFENGTKAGIENLQFYFQVQEKEASLAAAQAANAPASPDGTDAVTSAIEPSYETVINGIADPILLNKFYADDFPLLPAPMEKGAKGEDVKRVQRRLKYLEYVYTQPDGDFGPATETAVKAFQKRHKMEETGVCDQATIELMFSDKAKKALKPYVLKVSTEKQRVYAYAPDANEEYTVLKRTMKCSTGKNDTPTPKGTYQATTGPGLRWHYFKKFDCWAQYAWHITGDILFHSVIYYTKNGKVQQSTINNLGRKASHGCVRLSVEDAQWIYTHCPKYTKVIIY